MESQHLSSDVHVGSKSDTKTLSVDVQTFDMGREGEKKKAGRCRLSSGVLCHTHTHT